MYSFDLKYKNFVYPWKNSTVYDRLQFLGKEKIKIVYIYEKPDNSTFRYRVYNMCEVLNKSAQFSAMYLFVSELDFLLKYIERVDFIVLVRVRWSIELDKVFLKAAKKNIKVYFDVDDLIYDINQIPLIMAALGIKESEYSYNYWFSYISRISFAAKSANYCITTNGFLAKKITDFFKKECFCVKNFINQEQMIVSEKLSDLKSTLPNNNESILIGYFSGSPSHNNDFKEISSALYSVMEKDKRIKLRLVGYLDVPNNLREYVKNKRIEHIAIQNYLDLQVKIAECDINLIPLLNNDFTNCKSEIKYFEASIVKVETIATPTFVYKKIIQDGNNGYLAAPWQWDEKIQYVIENRGKVINSAKVYATENYFGDKIFGEIEKIFF